METKEIITLIINILLFCSTLMLFQNNKIISKYLVNEKKDKRLSIFIVLMCMLLLIFVINKYYIDIQLNPNPLNNLNEKNDENNIYSGQKYKLIRNNFSLSLIVSIISIIIPIILIGLKINSKNKKILGFISCFIFIILYLNPIDIYMKNSFKNIKNNSLYNFSVTQNIIYTISNLLIILFVIFTSIGYLSSKNKVCKDLIQKYSFNESNNICNDNEKKNILNLFPYLNQNE